MQEVYCFDGRRRRAFRHAKGRGFRRRAGGAMMAGFVASHFAALQLRGLSLEESARLATAFSIDALASLEAGISSLDNIRVLAAVVTMNRDF